MKNAALNRSRAFTVCLVGKYGATWLEREGFSAKTGVNFVSGLLFRESVVQEAAKVTSCECRLCRQELTQAVTLVIRLVIDGCMGSE